MKSEQERWGDQDWGSEAPHDISLAWKTPSARVSAFNAWARGNGPEDNVIKEPLAQVVRNSSGPLVTPEANAGFGGPWQAVEGDEFSIVRVKPVGGERIDAGRA